MVLAFSLNVLLLCPHSQRVGRMAELGSFPIKSCLMPNFQLLRKLSFLTTQEPLGSVTFTQRLWTSSQPPLLGSHPPELNLQLTPHLAPQLPALNVFLNIVGCKAVYWDLNKAWLLKGGACSMGPRLCWCITWISGLGLSAQNVLYVQAVEVFRDWL